MNYILHFQPKTPGNPISQSQIKQYFQSRGGYLVNEYQSLYSNEDTGVFFTFEYGGRRSPEAGADRDILPVYFNIDCGKPHIFVLEAEPELADFIRTFDLRVSDLTMKGRGYTEYDEMDFYRGWNSINEAVYHENTANTDFSTLPTLPVALMEKCWRWNYHVAEMHSEVGQAVFVPRIMLIEYQSAYFTAAVWTDALPIVLPRCDKIILYRRAMSRGLRIGKKEDIALIDFQEIEPLLKNYPRETEHLEYYKLIFQNPPEDLRQFIQGRKSIPSDKVRFFSFSQVHDRELIAKIRQPKTPA